VPKLFERVKGADFYASRHLFVNIHPLCQSHHATLPGHLSSPASTMVATKASPSPIRTIPTKKIHPLPVKVISLRRSRGHILEPPSDMEKYLHRPLPPIPTSALNQTHMATRRSEPVVPQSAPATTSQFSHSPSPLAAVLASGAVAQHSRRRSHGRASDGHNYPAIRTKQTRSDSNLRGAVEVFGMHFNPQQEDNSCATMHEGNCLLAQHRRLLSTADRKKISCLTVALPKDNRRDDLENYPWVIGCSGVALLQS